jgi:hypothetical protein
MTRLPLHRIRLQQRARETRQREARALRLQTAAELLAGLPKGKAKVLAGKLGVGR